jgi:excinuclease UvrABC nuclease subunit
MIKNKELSANGIIVLDKKTYSLSKLQKRIEKCPKKLPFKAINKQTQEEFGPFNSQKECQEKLNLSSRSHISEVLKGSRDSAYGYYFKYI